MLRRAVCVHDLDASMLLVHGKVHEKNFLFVSLLQSHSVVWYFVLGRLVLPVPFYSLLSHPLLSPITSPFHPPSILLSPFAGPFLRSASWSSGASRWPRGDGAEWRSSFRQWLNLSNLGERSQGTPNRTPWAPRTSRCVRVCVCVYVQEKQRERHAVNQ